MKKIKMDDMATRIAHRILEKVKRVKSSLPVIGRETEKTTPKKKASRKPVSAKSASKKKRASKREK